MMIFLIFRNFDQITLKAVMDIFRVYVPDTEYFPTMKEVTEFKNDFWEDKILRNEILGENVFSYLKPEGMISMRLSHPEHVLLFDRQLYFMIETFFISGAKYMAEGRLLFHSSMRQVRNLVDTEGYMIMKDRKETIKLKNLKVEQTLRFQNKQPRFCPEVYDETTKSLHIMSDDELSSLCSLLDNSLREGCVQVVTNIHIDDASQVASKMWKSASVCDIQLAGALHGVKGSESNNIILGLTDTATISLGRLFDRICTDFVRQGNEGFECYDSFTNKIEKVKMPVGVVLSDLPAKAEISPFKGYQGDVFCPRDMYNKRTDQGLEVSRDLMTVRRQIESIKNTATQAGRKRLGVQFGLDIENLDAVLDTLPTFDMTQDLPSGILHHFTLGWGKKSLIFLKNDILSDESLEQLCQIFDQVSWKSYLQRTNSNTLRKIGSQIGRNIRALLQVVWYGLWVLIWSDPDRYRYDLEVFLRVFFYIGKLNFLFYNKHEVSWSPAVMNHMSTATRTIVAIFNRDMEVIVPGPKTHDLQHHLHADIVKHGAPAGFDCQAGESKMKVQKLKNNYSNKAAPGKDVAVKYMRTEIIRHIVTGGALSDDGVKKASKNVLESAIQFPSLRSLLGIIKEDIEEGKASLMDYETVNGKRRQKKEKPVFDHVLLGVPDIAMKTCDRILTRNGPVFRQGGLYIKRDNTVQPGILIQVYKSSTFTYAVIESLVDSSHVNNDSFLLEVGMKIWKRSGRLIIVSNLLLIESLPLLHACKFEIPPAAKCEFVDGVVSVIEERQQVQQRKQTYRCLGKSGQVFVVSAACLSLPVGSNLACC